MSVAAVAALDTLTALDPSLLYVFVAGPSTGEGIAVALPGASWLVVDGCALGNERKESVSVIKQILRHWRRGEGDYVEGFVWTHPHDDHSVGVTQALDAFPPRWVGMAGEKKEADRVIALLRRHVPSVSAGSSSRERQAAVAVAKKVEDLLHSGVRYEPMLDGQTLLLAGGAITMTVCAPDVSSLQRVIKWCEENAPRRDVVNEASVVFELRWGAHGLVFGGDLPYFPTGSTTPIVGGWRDVMRRSPRLAGHGLLKVPHHGSIHALEPPLIAPMRADGVRDWVVTPFAKENLPRAATEEGLARLLDAQEPVRLTALPIRRDEQLPLPDVLTRSEVEARVQVAKGSSASPGLSAPARWRVTPHTMAWDDPLWCVAFNQERVVGRWRGRVACEVRR